MTGSHTGAAAHRDAAARGARQYAAFAILAVMIALFMMNASAERAFAQAPDSDDGTLTVDVTDGTTPAPTPPSTSPGGNATPSPTRPSGGGGGASGGGTGGGGSTPIATGTVTQPTILDPVAADDALDDAPSTGGILAMSGLTARASPSLAVGNGHVTLDFVVRNASSTAFDSTARFWIDNAVGGRIAEIDDIRVNALEPGETRRVQVRFDGLGQHFVLHAHARLTPPDSVEGVELDPISRDTMIVVPPLFLLSLLSVLGAVGGLLWWLLRSGALGMRFGRFGA